MAAENTNQKENKIIFDDNIKVHLDEIAERLWSGHAAIMVGAGYSKNADKKSRFAIGFPNWNELGNIFFEKLNGKKPENDDTAFINVLKLADEVCATYGRPVLEQLISENVPDLEYDPSVLHIKLLNLPWADVFTTNYDTLLERTSETIIDYKYDIVTNQQDLIYSTKPRIVKLHGSFPSVRPFIISEEDYRVYPQKFAPFVNTVQQAMLENTLCLIGFSGDDPNFLHWIGWIRDNLGRENSPKIYLILVSKISSGQEKLLLERNIIPLDLSRYVKDSFTYKDVFETLFGALSERKNEIDVFKKWPHNFGIKNIESENDLSVTLGLLRQTFPEWIIVPKRNREELIWILRKFHDFLEQNYLKKNISVPLNFVLEYDWINDKLLLPLTDDDVEMYQNTLLDWFNNGSDETRYDRNIVKLKLSLMRYFRQEGKIANWEEINRSLNMSITRMDLEISNSYAYEKCLFYISIFNIERLAKELEEWRTNNSKSFFEVKKAGLLAELGELQEAKEILEDYLIMLRKIGNSGQAKHNYRKFSEEAYLLRLLTTIKISMGDYNQDELDNSRLIKYNIDPWDDQHQITSIFEYDVKKIKDVETKLSFDLGKTVVTRYNNYDKHAIRSSQAFRYFEETGLPFQLNYMNTISDETILRILSYTSDYSPYLAISSLLRLGCRNKEKLDLFLSRKYLVKTLSKDIEKIVRTFLEILQNPQKVNLSKAKSIYKRMYYSSLLELISRLCIKTSYELRIEILTVFFKISNRNYFRYFENKVNIIKRLIASFTIDEHITHFKQYLDFPVEINSPQVVEPFAFLRDLLYVNKSDILKFVDQNYIDEKIDEYLKILEDKSRRKMVLYRLEILYRLDLLSETQKEKFIELLWSDINQNTNLPENTPFTKFGFTILPHPDHVDPKEFFRQFFRRKEFLEKSNGFSSTQIDDIQSLVKSVKYLTWETSDIIDLMDKLFYWFDENRQYLSSKGIEISDYDDFEDHINHFMSRIPALLMYIVFNRIEELTQDLKERVLNLVKEIRKYEIHTVELDLVYRDYVEGFDKSQVHQSLCSSNHNDVVKGLNAVARALELKHEKEELTEYLDTVTTLIKTRYKTNLRAIVDSSIRFLTNYNSHFSRVHLENMLFGLEFLLEESKPVFEDSDSEIKEKILLSACSAELAAVIQMYFEKYPDESLNKDVIKKWETRSLDSEEFSEVRKGWLDAKYKHSIK